MWLAYVVSIMACGGPAERLTETQKIERLIDHVARLKNAVFIRNGREYDAKTAAEHLRKKWTYARKEINSAREFIEKIATKSSFSGEPYRIRLGEGQVVQAGEYLSKQLDQIESAGKP